MRHGIDVFAQLSLISGQGTEVLVDGDKDIIAVIFPNLQAARQFLKQFPGSTNRRKILARLHEGLRLSDLKLQVKVSHLVIAQLTPSSQGGLASRLAGLDPVELRVLNILRAALSIV